MIIVIAEDHRRHVVVVVRTMIGVVHHPLEDSHLHYLDVEVETVIDTMMIDTDVTALLLAGVAVEAVVVDRDRGPRLCDTAVAVRNAL